MSPTRWATRNVSMHAAHFVLVLLCAIVAGGLIGLNSPFGAKRLTVTKGHAMLKHDGGTFQADRGGVTAYIPPDVAWTGRDGVNHGGGVPNCLKIPDGETVGPAASVEAGWTELRDPGGGGSLIVGWIHCL